MGANRVIYTGIWRLAAYLAVAWVVLVVGGCGALSSSEGSLDISGAKGYAACITGSGPPLTGGGHYARAKVDKDFVGTIEITPDCAIRVLSAPAQ